ncbi:GntR family transcriptional regulator [Rugosimonospora acidiphila]|uniref:GntR family transcriptional regulator n=1 Tax=Rugosimonospora acidiphila TaxID=556531 RepID=A0ABP9RLE7_9ACTN
MHPEDIAALLRRAVRERVLTPGQPLNQDELARRFGVSRIPLREALRTLSGEGLIVIRPGMGAMVIELDAHEVEELYDLRLQLEPSLARAVAGQVRSRDIDELDGLVQRMAQAPKPDPEEWSGLHYVFRRRLYEMSGRRHGLRLVTQLLNLVEPYSRYYAHVLGAQDRVGVELAGEVAALRADDGELLANLISANIEHVRSALVAAMGAVEAPRDRLDELFTDRH